MSETPTENIKSSAREKPDLLRNTEAETKTSQATKEKLSTKHKRIMSNDFQFHSQAGYHSSITAETGSIGNSNHNHLPRHTIKKDETSRPLKADHRRVQSNIIDTLGQLPTSYASLVKNKEAQELVKKYTTKMHKQKELNLKRQSKPTELTNINQNQPTPAKQLQSVSSTQQIFQHSNKSTKKSKLHKPTHSLFTSPFEQLFPKSTLLTHKRNPSSEFKGSLKGIKKDEPKVKAKKKEDRGHSAELCKKHWTLSLKTTKYFLATQNTKKQKQPNTRKSPEVNTKSSNNEGLKKKASFEQSKEAGQSKLFHVKNSSGLLSNSEVKQSKPKPSDQPKGASLKKAHHKKNPSLPAPNPTARLIENLNLPISMNSKQITMTPDESRRNSPRPSRPQTGPILSSRQGSFIIEEDAQEGHEHYFSHLLYSKQKEEEKPKNIHLNFCESFDEVKNSDRDQRVPRGSNFRPTTRLNTQRSQDSKHNYLLSDKPAAPNHAVGRGTPANIEKNPERPISESALIGGFAIQEPSRHSRSARSLSKATSNREEEQKLKKGSRVAFEEAGASGNTTNMRITPLMSVGDEFLQKGSDVPMVLQKLMLVAKIKDFYSRESVKDIQTTLDFYKIVKRIGEGSFGKVYQAVSILTGKEVAIKKFDKAEIKTEMAKQKIFQEAKIVNMLDHPNVARLLEVFENKGNIFCVMEYAKEGDILNLIKTRGPLDENTARFIVVQVAHGLKYCHSKNILHRDIKLDNVLLSENYTAKICDFGISRVVKKGELIFEDSGTPAYTAPELVSGKGYSGFQADVWSLGIMLFVMVTGKVPFKDKSKSPDVLHQLIKKGEFSFPPNAHLSQPLQDLISRMLCVDPDQRITIDELLLHDWFRHPMIEQLTTYLNLGGENSQDYATKKLLDLGFPAMNVKRTVQRQILNHIYCCYQIYRHT